jgi:hypothetical protein
MKGWVHEEVIDAMQLRPEDNPEIPVLRKQTVEHVLVKSNRTHS